MPLMPSSENTTFELSLLAILTALATRGSPSVPAQDTHAEYVLRSSREVHYNSVFITLRRMEAKGLITSSTEPRRAGVSGPERVVFRPTAAGRKALRAHAQMLGT